MNDTNLFNFKLTHILMFSVLTGTTQHVGRGALQQDPGAAVLQ